MKLRIDALSGIGQKARKIATEIGGNYVIAVATEAAKSKKRLCVYKSGKGLNFTPGATHQRVLVESFPYSNEEQYIVAYKNALKFIAKRQGHITAEIGDEIDVVHGGKQVKARVLSVA